MTVGTYFEIYPMLNNTPFEKCIDASENMYANYALFIDRYRIDTNVFNKYIFQKCSEVYPNIARVFRPTRFVKITYFHVPINLQENFTHSMDTIKKLTEKSSRLMY